MSRQPQVSTAVIQDLKSGQYHAPPLNNKGDKSRKTVKKGSMPPSLTATSYKSKSEAELAWQIGCRWSYSSSSSSDSSCEGGSSDAEFIPQQNKSKYSQQNKTATIARNQRKNQNSNNKDNKQRSQSDQRRNTQTRSNQHDAEDESYLSHPHHHQMITRDYQYSHPQRNVDNICYENNDMNDRQDNNGLDNDAMGLSNNDETTAVCNNLKKNMVMEKPCCSNNHTFPHPPVYTSPCRAPEAELERSIRQYPASPLTHKPLPPPGEETEGYNEERSNISRATTKLTESCHEVHAGQNQRLNRGKDFHGQGKPSSTSNFPPPPETRLQHKQPLPPQKTAAPTSHNTLERKSVRSVRDHFNGLDVHHNNLHVEECALDENSSFSCGLCCNGSQNCIAAQNTISPINYGCNMNAKHEMIRSNFEMNAKDHIIVNEAMVSCADNMIINKSANGNCDSDCAAFCTHHSKNAPFCVHNFKNAQFCVHDSKQSNSSTDSGFTEMASAELYSHQYIMNNHFNESNRGEIIMDNDNYQECTCPNCSQQQLAGNNPQNFMGSQSFCCSFNSATGTAASRGKFLAGGGVPNCCIFPLNQLTTAQNSTLLLQHNHLPQPHLHQQSEINCPGLISKHSACGGELIHNQQVINNNSGKNVVHSDHNNHFVQHEEDGQDKYCNQDSQQLLEQKQIGSSCIQSKRLHCTKTVTRTNDPHQQYFEDDSKLTTATTTTPQQQFGQCMQLLTDGLARSTGDYSGEGTHGEQDNHDDNVGGNYMGGLENKDSYDSDSSSEEEIGHIIGDVSVNGFQNFYSTPQRTSAARKSFTTSNSGLKNVVELDNNRQNGVVSAREFDLSASLPALTRDARLSSMRSQSVSLHQVSMGHAPNRYPNSGQLQQPTQNQKQPPPIPKPRQPPPYPAHARLPPPPPPPHHKQKIESADHGPVTSSQNRLPPPPPPVSTRLCIPPSNLSTPPLLHSSPYINRSKKPPVVPRRNNQNCRAVMLPGDLGRPLSGSEVREMVMAPLTEHQIMKTLKINLENLHFVTLCCEELLIVDDYILAKPNPSNKDDLHQSADSSGHMTRFTEDILSFSNCLASPPVLTTTSGEQVLRLLSRMYLNAATARLLTAMLDILRFLHAGTLEASVIDVYMNSEHSVDLRINQRKMSIPDNIFTSMLFKSYANKRIEKKMILRNKIGKDSIIPNICNYCFASVSSPEDRLEDAQNEDVYDPEVEGARTTSRRTDRPELMALDQWISNLEDFGILTTDIERIYLCIVCLKSLCEGQGDFETLSEGDYETVACLSDCLGLLAPDIKDYLQHQNCLSLESLIQDLHWRCTNAIFNKIARVLQETQDPNTRPSEESISERVLVFSIAILWSDPSLPPASQQIPEPSSIDSLTLYNLDHVLGSVNNIMCNNIPADPAAMRAYSPPQAGSSNPITQLFRREFSSFGFLCHLYLEDNKFLDTLTMAEPKYSEKRQIFPFSVIATRPQNKTTATAGGSGANASLTFDRKFVASELRRIGIVERGNLAAGCVHSGQDDDITSESSFPPNSTMTAAYAAGSVRMPEIATVTPTAAYAAMQAHSSATLAKKPNHLMRLWNQSAHNIHDDHGATTIEHHNTTEREGGVHTNREDTIDNLNIANNHEVEEEREMGEDNDDLNNKTEMDNFEGDEEGGEWREGDDGNLVYLTALKYGLDLNSIPALPHKRSYIISGGVKIDYKFPKYGNLVSGTNLGQ